MIDIAYTDIFAVNMIFRITKTRNLTFTEKNVGKKYLNVWALWL